MPERIQLKHTKGWRMPPNTVKVDRTTKWGNPFTKDAAIESGYTDALGAQNFVVEAFHDWLTNDIHSRDWWQGPDSDRARRVFVEDIGELRGKNLACWCPEGTPCHATILLELANR